jgi:hypothetical protein
MKKVICAMIALLVVLTSFAAIGKVLAEDTDGDGLLDSWEIQYFGHLDYGADDDPDLDDVINIDEYNANTNPADPLSKPRLPGDDQV